MRVSVVALSLALELCSTALAAQSGTGGPPQGTGTTVSGVVRDSIARTPLANAAIQLVGDESMGDFIRTATSDSLGRFVLGDVPTGRFTLGFLHPMLDSLGLEPVLRQVVVTSRTAVRADLGIPSAAQLRRTICGERQAASVADSGAVVLGFVRDARTRESIARAAIVAEWMEVSYTTAGIRRSVPRLVATSAANGWYALCDVPGAGLIALTASQRADSTGRLDISIPTDGFLRRDLYLGAPATVTVATPTASPTDSVVRSARTIRRGDVRLTGVALAADGARPLPGALVTLIDGPQTRATADGSWTLNDAPPGTRMLDVRAVGYSPDRRPVDVIAGATPVRVTLSTLRAVLDTVRVSAARSVDRRQTGFSERRRSFGAGRFLGPEDIARRNALTMSEVLRALPGLRMERTENASDGTVLLVRSATDERCSPETYLDGRNMGVLNAEDIDGWVLPAQVFGVELYASGIVPPQFNRGLADTGCGVLVIWTK